MRRIVLGWCVLGIGFCCLAIPSGFSSPSQENADSASKSLLGGFELFMCRRCDDVGVAWDERNCTTGACACPTSGFVSVTITDGTCDEVTQEIWACVTFAGEGITKREYTPVGCPSSGEECDQDKCDITGTQIPIAFIDCQEEEA